MPQAPPAFAFEPMFERLRQEGFALGVDHQLRLQQLLDRLEGGIQPGDMKTLLCPLFATNRAQQDKFYAIFDELYRVETADGGKVEVPILRLLIDLEPAPFWKRLLSARWLYLALAPIAAAVLWWWLQEPPKVEPVSTQQQTEQPQGLDLAPESPLPPVPPHTHRLEFPTPPTLPLSPEDARARAMRWVIVVSPLLAFAAYWLYRRTRKALLDRGSAGKPPHFWPIQCPPLGDALFRIPAVHELARTMRRRQPVEDQVLDVGGTIRATIGSLGFPRFQYAAVRRPVEWVALIERHSQQDHFAHMMADLMKVLKAEDVLISRYFYERDPRRLTADSGEEILLSGLAARLPGARLLIFGSSGNVVHPVTGRLEEWASIFQAWPHRALLLADAPRPRRRQRLEDAGFGLAPASVSGLKGIVDFFEAGGTLAGRDWPRFEPLAAPLTETEVRAAARTTELHWLAACAVYPELNWNLSLRLGHVLGVPDEAGASRLARMEWMREGLIPSLDRERLWGHIPEPKRPAIQTSIGELLQLHQPPKDSFAWETWQYALRIYKPPDPPPFWQRLREWARGGVELAPDAVPDAVFLRFMNWRPAGRFQLPVKVEHWLYEDGLRGLGYRAVAWLPMAAAAALLLGVFLRPWRVDEKRLVEGVVVGPREGVTVGGQTPDANGRFRIPMAPAIAVEAPHPNWPQPPVVRGIGLEVRVAPGRPREMPFQLSAAFIVSPIAPGEETAVTLEFAGPLQSTEFSSDAAPSELPVRSPRQTGDGEVFYFKPASSRRYAVTLNGRPYPDLDLRVVVGGDVTAVPPKELCARYDLCGYDRKSWRQQFLRPVRTGTWQVFVSSQPAANSLVMPVVRDDLRKRFPNLDFDMVGRSAIVVASGLESAARAEQIMQFARESGVSKTPFVRQQVSDGLVSLSALPQTTTAGVPAVILYEIAGSGSFFIEEQGSAGQRAPFRAAVNPGRGSVSVSPRVTTTYALIRGRSEKLGEVTVTVTGAPRVGEERTNRVDGLIYVWIPPGTFRMGCSPRDTECRSDESPAHQVTITKGFWMGKSEVTQAAYEKVTGGNPSSFKGPNRPVESVAWKEASDYCGKVGGRLPTEAEWEYAARAGSTAARYGDVDQIAWHQGNSNRSTHDVRTKTPNAFGLHDMLGNVWEWTADWNGAYNASAASDPKGPASGQYHVVRGGSWGLSAGWSRASDRDWNVVVGRGGAVGFRCVGEIP